MAKSFYFWQTVSKKVKWQPCQDWMNEHHFHLNETRFEPPTYAHVLLHFRRYMAKSNEPINFQYNIFEQLFNVNKIILKRRQETQSCQRKHYTGFRAVTYEGN